MSDSLILNFKAKEFDFESYEHTVIETGSRNGSGEYSVSLITSSNELKELLLNKDNFKELAKITVIAYLTRPDVFFGKIEERTSKEIKDGLTRITFHIKRSNF